MSFFLFLRSKKTPKSKKGRETHLNPARVVEVGRHRDQRLHVRRVRDDAPDRHQGTDVRGPHGAKRQGLAFTGDRGAEQDVVAAEQVRREAVLRVGDEARGAGSPLSLGAGLAL